MPFVRVRIVQHDSDEMSEGAGGSGGSRSAIASGGAILEASEAVIARGRRIAGHVLEAAAEDIEFAGGEFRVAGTDRSIDIMSLAAEARANPALPEDLAGGLGAKRSHKTSPISFPNGCHVCEVEIDPDTGETAVERYTVVDDFGTVLNPLIVEGQVHGGIAQGLGQVLLENTVYDDDGQLVTGSYMDYAMPRADHMAAVDFTTHPGALRHQPARRQGLRRGRQWRRLPGGDPRRARRAGGPRGVGTARSRRARTASAGAARSGGLRRNAMPIAAVNGTENLA